MSTTKLPAQLACLLLLVTSACRADDPPKPDSTLEIVQFKAPAGWKLTAPPDRPARVFTSPDSNGTEQAIILLTVTPAQDNLDLSAAFEAATKEITAQNEVVESSPVTTTKTRQGFDAVSRTLVTRDKNNQQMYARLIAAKVENRMVGIYFLATPQALYDQHQAEMAALLQSVSFAAAGAANPLGANAAIELAALEKQKQELLAKIAEIEARQRQLTGTATPAARAAAPQDELLASARKQYASTLANRRKPHVISGDILGLDGKPIANVASYRVFVWGTTIAAEKTNYSLEVDQNGHFEQQVPDGLYQVDAHCIVTQAGHRVPVDLVWLDDKKQGVVQASGAGIVRDFRLVISGLKPGADPKQDHAYFGGDLRVSGPNYDVQRGSFGPRHPGARVIVTLTAQSTLLDGTKIDPISFEMAPDELNYSSDRHNIPVAVYKASVVLIEKSGAKTQLPCANNFNGQYAESAEIHWESFKDNAEALSLPGLYIKE